MSSDTERPQSVEAQLIAHAHLIKHLIVTVLARTPDPLETFEGLQQQLTAAFRHRPVVDSETPEGGNPSEAITRQIVEDITGSMRETLEHALAQISKRSKS